MKKNILTLFAVIIGLAANIGLLHAETDNWSAHTEEVTPSGDTYTITSAGQLAWIASQVNAEVSNSFEGKTIKLNDNIDLAAYEWTPIGNVIANGFKGIFDGNGKTISNMNVSVTFSNQQPEIAVGGLLGYILDKAVVKNVTIIGNSSIKIGALRAVYAGSIVGEACGTPDEQGMKTTFTGDIENCHSAAIINATITPTADNKKGAENSIFAGGIAGSVYGKEASATTGQKVSNCSSTGSITSTCTNDYTTNGIMAGGIVGRAQNVRIQNCYSTGKITSTEGYTPYAGGIVGHISYVVQVSDCYSTGDITSSANRTGDAYSIAGGISGTLSQNSIIKNCYATGNISAALPNTTNSSSEVWAGGIVGYGINKAGSKIENCAALNGAISVSGNNSFSNKAVHRIFGKNEGKTTLSGNYAYVGIELSIDSQSTIVTAEGIDKEDGTILISFDLPTLFDKNNGWMLSETTLPTLIDCGTVAQTGKPQSDYFTPATDLRTLLARDNTPASIDLKKATIYDFSKEPFVIAKKVTLKSADATNKATIKGNICIETDDVVLDNLKIETESTGTKYWQKNAVSVIAKKVTITNCDFKGSVQTGHGNEWVVNGIVLFPTNANPTYTVTGNTFTMFKGETADKKWTATAIIMADGYTLDKKENGQVVLPAVSNFNETAIANANTYTDCFADYIHTTNSKYVYSRTQSANGVADAWLSMDKGTIDAPTVTNEAALAALNATEKPALTGKAIAIRCSNAWLVTNESLAGSDLPVLVITKAEGGDYEAVKKTYAPTIDNSTLTASTIEAGQTLSASVLSGGKATVTNGNKTVEIAGTFTWEDPKTAAFEKQTFAVTKTETNATITISGTGSESLNQVPYGTELTASVAPAEGYKLLSLVVNGKEIANGGSFVVTATTNVNAVMRKLATIVIDKTPQTFVYDGSKKEFVVKTIPAGIGGFKVEYEGIPQEVENHIQMAYKVIITRDADDVYAAVTAEQGTIDGGLVILAAEMKGVAIPEAGSGTISTSSDQGTYAWKTGGGESNAIHDAIFTPTSGNYKTATFSILTGNATPPTTVTLDWENLQTRAVTVTPKVSFNVTGGTLAALNGSASLSSGSTLYATQKIRLVATPDATHAAKVTWSVSGSGASLSDQTATEATLTLADANTTVTATFDEKVSPTFPGLSGLDKAVYDGTVYGTGMPAIKGGAVRDNWSVTFKQEGVVTSTPINAGTYDIYVSRPADVIYDAVIDKSVGSFTIAQKVVTASVTAATPVLKGQSLAQSVLSGTADVDGSFVWIDPTVLMTATGNQKAKFVPANANYKESGALTTEVTVNEATGVTLRTLNVNITNPEKGTVTMTLNGGEVVAGASVTKDDKLIVTYAATAANYKALATIGGNTYTSGTEYTVPESGNVEVVVSFVYNNPNPGTDPGTDPDPSTVDVTGVTLVPASKTLSINETLALEATVTPSNATDKGVSWSSNAPGIASVDNKGNVKALKAGTSTITVTTNDGGFTATCKITVSVSTGIDDILSGTRVYAQEGRIVVEPAMIVQVLVADMTGRVIWQGKLSEKKQMTVSAGVYVVRLSNDQGIQTQKVIVQ
ncbi:MAG: Ig-like domain-containing protein [Parabacteroides sp.]|nr:Ig-like domain-containing protein [Parabacteroides sp.]